MKATRSTTQKRKPASTFEDDTRTTAQAIIALVRTRDDAEAPVLRLVRAYAATPHHNRDKRGELYIQCSTATTSHTPNVAQPNIFVIGAGTSILIGLCRHFSQNKKMVVTHQENDHPESKGAKEIDLCFFEII